MQNKAGSECRNIIFHDYFFVVKHFYMGLKLSHFSWGRGVDICWRWEIFFQELEQLPKKEFGISGVRGMHKYNHVP